MQCGAKTRNGGTCKNKPVTGSNRCRMHGGKHPRGVDSPHFKHGRYSKYAPAAIAEKIETFADDDPLDLLPELHTQRALLAEYLTRFEHGKLTRDDIYAFMSWTGDIGKQAERIVKMRNDSALTAAEVMYLQSRIVDVVVKYIDDPVKRTAFVKELFGSIAAEHPGPTESLQLEPATRAESA